MTVRERLEAFWRGGKPDRVPYTAYRRFFVDLYDRPEFQALVKDGFGLTYNLPVFKTASRKVETASRTFSDGVTRNTIRTPLGEIHELNRKGRLDSYLLDWPDKRYLETREDYRVMTWAVEHTVVEPAFPEFAETAGRLHPWEIPQSAIGRSPLQTLLVDWAGIEHFAIHLFEFEEEVRALFDALRRQFRRKAGIVAEGPCAYVSCLENFSAETLGPKRFEEFLLPVYEECFPLLRQAGKVVGCHYDGRTRPVRDQVRRAPFDVLEAFTEPPEGDQSVAEARAVWPEKLLWTNLNVALYEKPDAAIRAHVARVVRAGAVSGTRFALECSEDRPPRWEASVRAVIEGIRDA